MDVCKCRECVGKAIAALLLGTVGTMLWARQRRIVEKANKIVIYTGSDQTTMESIVSAQHGLRNVYDLVQSMNVILLKIWSILVSKAPKVPTVLADIRLGNFSRYSENVNGLIFCNSFLNFVVTDDLDPLLIFDGWLQHADLVMVAMVGAAVILAVVPFKFILMALTLCLFVATSKIGKYMQDEKVDRRLKEWWDSIPIVPVEFVEKLPDS